MGSGVMVHDLSGKFALVCVFFLCFIVHGTAVQALAGWEASDVLVACTGASTIDVNGVADLAERLGNLDAIDLIAVCRFDARQKLAHAPSEKSIPSKSDVSPHICK